MRALSAEARVLGTAGHVDHGKTALVRALSGVDTDRLPEEKARGVSIALGYAPLALPSGRELSVVDVPGHERFVRTMVAGASGIDLFLMVVAADDGVMPQTREHARVLAALEVERGVVAVTKADLADPARAAAEARELLPGAEVVAVSARTGAGLAELRRALDRAAAEAERREGAGDAARLHVDRVLSIRGTGTVVTGTLWSGSAGAGDALELLPAGRRVRVRSVQVHDEPVERAAAARRVAVALTGVRRDEVSAGDVLAAPGAGVRASWRLDVRLDFRPPMHGARVQVHHGTRESPARLAALGGRFGQLRLQRPLLCLAGDRIVVRSIAPPDTLGGGVVLDPAPARHGPGRDVLARLTRLARGEPEPSPSPPAPSEAVPAAAAPAALSPAALELERRLHDAGFEPPADRELPARELASLRAAGRAVRVGPALHFHAERLAEVRERVVALAGEEGSLTLAALRDDLGSSRRYAQALLEHFDAEKLTLRRGEHRVLRRSAAPPGR